MPGLVWVAVVNPIPSLVLERRPHLVAAHDAWEARDPRFGSLLVGESVLLVATQHVRWPFNMEPWFSVTATIAYANFTSIQVEIPLALSRTLGFCEPTWECPLLPIILKWP